MPPVTTALIAANVALFLLEMAAHGEGQPHARAPAGLLGELEDDALERDGVIVPDGACLFVAEDGVEVDGAERDEG